jgi:dUTP pyrophosphatase
VSINTPRLAIEVLEHAEGLPLPYYATAGSAGLDLLAAVQGPVEIPVGDRRLIPTGLRLAIPEGFEGQVRMRSGLALRHGLALPNAPGTIDSDYRGELQVLIVNLGREPYWVERGARIAQLVIAPVIQVEIARVDSVDTTVRGEGGFGHTGVRG